MMVRKLRMVMPMDILFIETSIFSKYLAENLTDDEYAALQTFLSNAPDAGAVIRGTGGLRKIRWLSKGKGKSGGIRAIYYWRTAANRIYFLTLYNKSVKDTLTASERAAWRKVVEVIEGE